MLEIYHQSKIAFDIPYDDGRSQGVGMRPFEVMSCGACLFVYDVRQDMARTFVPEREYVPFLTDSELTAKVKRYLTSHDQRLAIARTGYKTLAAKHTFKERIKTIIETADSLTPSKTP